MLETLNIQDTAGARMSALASNAQASAKAAPMPCRARAGVLAGLLCTGLLAGALCCTPLTTQALADATFDNVEYDTTGDATGDTTGDTTNDGTDAGGDAVVPDDSGNTQPDGGDSTPAPSPAPTLIASRSEIPTLTAGQSVDVAITFENTGDVAVRQPLASFTPSSGLVIVGNASTLAMPDIEPHGKQTVLVTVKALESSSTSAQSLNIDTRFSYESGGALVQGSAQDSVPIQCLTTSDTTGSEDNSGSTDSGNAGSTDSGSYDSGSYDYYDAGSYVYDNGSGGTVTQTSTAGTTAKPVPNVIVTNFSYGDGSSAVAAGSTFALTFSFTNTSTSLAVENLVVSVDTGDQFTIANGTNTFYSANLGANATQQQTLNLKAIAGEKAATGSISISFKYEYVESQERKTANTEVKLTVPVYQPDRFELTAPTAPEYATVGSECTLALAYVNKGKSAVSNVAVSITGEGVSTDTPQVNVGNIESGKSGNIGMAFTPTQSGTLNLTLTVEYENANDETVTKTFPLTFDVQDDSYLYMEGDDSLVEWNDEESMGDEAQEGLPLPAIVGIAVGAFLVLVGIVAGVRKHAKKARKAAAAAADDDWEGYGTHVIPLDQMPQAPIAGAGEGMPATASQAPQANATTAAPQAEVASESSPAAQTAPMPQAETGADATGATQGDTPESGESTDEQKG